MFVSEVSRTQQKLKKQSNSAAMHDQLVRELQARESDLTEALGAKDSQLAVLRVRLDESDRTLNAKDRELDDFRMERERYNDISLKTNYFLAWRLF